MIKSALVFIKNQLDQYLVNRFDLDESTTVLNYLVEQNGSVPQKNQNKMVLTLINLDHETSKQYYGGQQRIGNQSVKVNPAVHFNVDLLFTASFDDYDESLKFLNATISFFQGNNVLDEKKCSDMPDGITSLNFEIENSSYFETHNLWSAMGAKYQPSIIYKVRHVSIQNDEINRVLTNVSTVKSEVAPLNE